MAKNDVILLDGIIDQRLANGLPSNEKDEVFEFMALEEALRPYDLSHDEIKSGWIDGGGDGGIDGFFIFINGHPLEDIDGFTWPRSNGAIEVWLITCKHHSTFAQQPLDAVLATIQELFNFSLELGDLKGTYSEELLNLRTLLQAAYRQLSIIHPILTFNVVYASRGDTSSIGESVAARARQIESVLSELFSSCSAKFSFMGASELVDLHRKSKIFSLDLPFSEHLETKNESYVLLVKLSDYWKFVSDESGNLRRYLFDSNVRDFLGENGVNADIACSLEDETAPDFWWLNNGVTILATNATVPGKIIQLQNIQIVNGLQTTETVFRHFQSGKTTSSERTILVKIIVSSDPQARDRIIQATNNQSPVEVAALHATDKIQRDIEQILERDGWYYERRKNYYRNIGKPHARFVTPNYLANAVVTLILKNPSQAKKLKPTFMKKREAYESVFSEQLNIKAWPVLVGVYKQIDTALAAIQQKQRERFIRLWRPLLAFLVVSKQLKSFGYTITDFVEKLDIEKITKEEVDEIWAMITDVHKAYQDKSRPRKGFNDECYEAAAKRYNLSGIEQIGRRAIANSSPIVLQQKTQEGFQLSEFTKTVDGLLPEQPWKPGEHLKIATQLGCKASEVSAAIQQLILKGKRHHQRNGVVYDSTGGILRVDPTRTINES